MMLNRLVYFNYTLQKCEIIPVELPIARQRYNVCIPCCHNKVCILRSVNVELIKICMRLMVQAWNYWIFGTFPVMFVATEADNDLLPSSFCASK